MHYHEVFPDGTEFGVYHNLEGSRTLTESEFWAYHEEIAKREHPTTRGHRLPKLNHPHESFEAARSRTALISTYRVHEAKYYQGGRSFPEMWKPFPKKIEISQRYSPPGTIGYYFGLNVNAALDEARFGYGPDVEGDTTKLVLVHRTYYEDILYLAPVLWQVWGHLNLPEMPLWQMYLSIMDPDTSNNYANEIGLWAREYGYKGIMYPSARYADWDKSLPIASLFPILNFTPIGSYLCEHSFGPQMVLQLLAKGISETMIDSPPKLVTSEPNLVIFDEKMVAGLDRPVFYTTYFMHEARKVDELDERAGTNEQITFGLDKKEIVLALETPDDTWLIRVPRK